MSPKVRSIIGWVLTAVITFIFAGSAYAKLAGSPQAVKGATALGLSAGAFQLLGVVEVLSLILFIIPRTGLLGTLLLAAYLGGAIATHLEHQQAITAPVVIQCIVWITATIRFPELSRRLMGNPAI